ncbi:substrate-binding domain-containing protein [symbiont of Argiope bruennichi]|uniref:PstS family phosphate ABC transporter substrate-binding protein n=1 Tax=symbiont of Argiope bruennichi TaxID=2810479 RepID=UPI003DA385EF
MHRSIANFFKYFLKLFCLSLFLILIFLFPTKNIIYSIGSTTVLPLMEKLGDNYYHTSDTKIAVAGGGSTVGVNMIQKGLTNIGNASRNPSNDEHNQSVWVSKQLSTFPIAYDGILIIANLGDLGNKTLLLDISKLIKIYEGNITNWRDVATELPNLKITLFNRESGSGTLDSFSNALKKYNNNIKINFSSSCNVINSNTQMIDLLENTPGSIGYAQLAYLDEIIQDKLILPDLKTDKGTIFTPSSDKGATDQETIQKIKEDVDKKIYESVEDPNSKTHSNYYLFWHSLNLIISLNEANIKTIKNYIHFIFTKQDIVAKAQYLPVYDGNNFYYDLNDSKFEKKSFNKCINKNDKQQECIFKLFTENPDSIRKPWWWSE